MRKRTGIKRKIKRLRLSAAEVKRATADPLPNGKSGKSDRDRFGRFMLGNPGGPGSNPLGHRVNEYRATLFACLTRRKFANVVTRLIGLAEAGDIAAIRILLDRCLGRVWLDVAAELVKNEAYDPDETFL